MSTAVEEDLHLLVSDMFDNLWTVTIYNDDTITFDHVIATLCTVLHITTEAATAHAVTAHNNGSAVVAALPEDEAVSTAKQIRTRGIPATAEPT